MLSNVVWHPRRVVLEDLQTAFLQLRISAFHGSSELLSDDSIELSLQEHRLGVHELRSSPIVMESHRVIEHRVHQLHPVVERPSALQRVVEPHRPTGIRAELRIVLGRIVFEVEVRRIAVQTDLLQTLDHAQKIGFLRIGGQRGRQQIQLVVEQLAGISIPVDGRYFLRAVVSETVGQKCCSIVRVQLVLPRLRSSYSIYHDHSPRYGLANHLFVIALTQQLLETRIENGPAPMWERFFLEFVQAAPCALVPILTMHDAFLDTTHLPDVWPIKSSVSGLRV